jgi:hypothetical protein
MAQNKGLAEALPETIIALAEGARCGKRADWAVLTPPFGPFSGAGPDISAHCVADPPDCYSANMSRICLASFGVAA